MDANLIRRTFLVLLSLLFMGHMSYAVPSNTVSIPNSFTPNTVAQSSQVNADFNEVQSKFNAHSHTDITQVGTITTGGWNASTITPQYGGTGKDWSGVAQGSIPYFNGTGTLSTLAPSTAGYTLQTNGAGADPSFAVNSGPKHFVTRGFEASGSALKTAVTIYSGTLYHGTAIVDLATDTVISTTTGSDYASGSTVSYAGGAGWNYIGVASNATISVKGVFFLGTIVPTYSDTNGNTDGTSIYTKIGGTYYRVIGAIRQNTSNQNTNGFFQQGNLVMYDQPISVATAISAGAWSSATSCGAAMPAISNLGLFGMGESANTGSLFIRPNGSVWSINYQNGLSSSVNGHTNSEQRLCFTDSSQQIQYYNNAATTSMALDMEGYYLKIRD